MLKKTNRNNKNTSTMKKTTQGTITPDPKSVAHIFKSKKKGDTSKGKPTRVTVILQI